MSKAKDRYYSFNFVGPDKDIVENYIKELEQQNKEYREILAKIVKVFPMGFTHIEYKDKALELLNK